MAIKNGDLPAYPSIDETKSVMCDDGAYASAVGINYGLTKREMFAMAAMQGLLANSTVKLNIWPTGADNSILSGVSVALADALLAELEK